MKKPIGDCDIEPVVWYRGTDREISGRALSDAGGDARIGFGLLELSPGCNTLPAHYHTLEEEHLYVLDGEGLLYLGDNVFPLGPGSYVNFPAGQPYAHYLANESDQPLRYLMVGERLEADTVVYAPRAATDGGGVAEGKEE